MLSRQRLLLAIDIHSRSYKLLRWVGAAIEKGLIRIERVEQHSDSPDAAFQWLNKNYQLLPPELKPDKTHLQEFASFFWTYLTSSFDVVAQPAKLLQPGNCGCSCPMCARIKYGSHLQPKRLTNADKRRAFELTMDRIAALAKEENVPITPEHCHQIAGNPDTRRPAAYSTYGSWLINRLSGYTDGPAVLALWREIAWSEKGSPIQGFSLRHEDFAIAERSLLRAMENIAEKSDTPTGIHRGQTRSHK